MRAIYGVGAACVTVIRMAARRHGLIERSVPQAAPSRHRVPEAVIDRLAHLVFGVATAIVAEELTVHADRGPAPDGTRHWTRAG